MLRRESSPARLASVAPRLLTTKRGEECGLTRIATLILSTLFALSRVQNPPKPVPLLGAEHRAHVDQKQELLLEQSGARFADLLRGVLNRAAVELSPIELGAQRKAALLNLPAKIDQRICVLHEHRVEPILLICRQVQLADDLGSSPPFAGRKALLR